MGDWYARRVAVAAAREINSIPAARPPLARSVVWAAGIRDRKGTALDVTTLLTVMGLFLSIVVGNAAVFGDSLFASIAVPKALETAGFDKLTAERLFAAHVAWYIRLPTILPTPSVSTSSSPNFAMALAKPIQMQDVVYAVQTQLRSDVVSATGAIMDEPGSKQLSMLVIVNSPPDPPVTLTFKQPDGDPKALIAAAARETMITIAPYRVALSDLAGVLTGDKDALAKARETVMRGLAQPWDPSEPSATEIVLLHNLMAVLSIERRDGGLARHHFALAHGTPGASSPSYAFIFLNEAFLALTERKTAEAEAAFRKGMALLDGPMLRLLRQRTMVLEALIAWQGGHEEQAEKLFREASTDTDTEIEPHYYLAMILKQRGDDAGAAEQLQAARISARFDQHYASLAHTVLGIDIKTGDIDIRAFLTNLPNIADQAPAGSVATTPAKPAAAQ